MGRAEGVGFRGRWSSLGVELQQPYRECLDGDAAEEKVTACCEGLGSGVYLPWFIVIDTSLSSSRRLSGIICR